MHLFNELKKREKNGHLIRVGMIGAGFLASGVIRQLVKTPGMKPAVVANRTLEKAVNALLGAGISKEQIEVCETRASAEHALRLGKYIATSVLKLPIELDEIDVISENTGDLLIGAEIGFCALQAHKHFIAANAETQATIGAILRREADLSGVIYSDIDGDQPGLIRKLRDYVEGIGFRPIVLGNCKGVMKRYATPETQAAYCRENPIQPWIATAAADGTKLNLEMCLVSNATGALPAKTGMSGVQTSIDTVIQDFEKANLLTEKEIVEYTLGIPVGVFVIVYEPDKKIAHEMQYFKMGNGPYYLFFSPHVICQFDAVPGIAGAVIYGEAPISPLRTPVSEVVAFAKRDLEGGKKVDGIGGFDCYGMIAERSPDNCFLPIGLSSFVRLIHKVEKDQPIRWADVEIIQSNFLIDLYRQQEAKLIEEKKIGQERFQKVSAMPR